MDRNSHITFVFTEISWILRIFSFPECSCLLLCSFVKDSSTVRHFPLMFWYFCTMLTSSNKLGVKAKLKKWGTKNQ